MENLDFIRLLEVARFCKTLDSDPSFREVADHIDNLENDFEVDNVRFIEVNAIDEVLAEELENDYYSLGCFDAHFIANQANWPVELVQAAQNGEAYGALGKAIADNADMREFAAAYADADGYGHHFNHYDGEMIEFDVNGATYYVFDKR